MLNNSLSKQLAKSLSHHPIPNPTFVSHQHCLSPIQTYTTKAHLRTSCQTQSPPLSDNFFGGKNSKKPAKMTDPSPFFDKLLVKHSEAMASGHLIYYGAETFLVQTGGNNEIHYHIRHVPALNKKPEPSKSIEAPKEFVEPQKRNPFLPCDEELLFSSSLLPNHNIVLNKFCVIPGHTLLTTKAFESQSEPLSLTDVEALFAILQKFSPIKTLGFFNCGKLSGASQPHKHLQLVPLTEQEPPIQKFLSESLANQVHDTSLELTCLPYLHRVARLSSNNPNTAYSIYSQMLHELGDKAQHHNLTVFDGIMYLLPRSKEKFEVSGDEFSINSLGAVHMVLARSSDQITRLKDQMGLGSQRPIPDSLWIGEWVGWSKSKV